MNWNHTIRQIHRWLSILFTLAVIANFVALALGSTAVWIGFVALVPLFLLLFSGLYMFFLPYFARGRGQRQVAGE
jgi:hypothetical protein